MSICNKGSEAISELAQSQPIKLCSAHGLPIYTPPKNPALNGVQVLRYLGYYHIYVTLRNYKV